MFNTKFNLTHALNDLPFNIRKTVMFSMVASLNARIFNAADRFTVKLLEDGYEHDTLKALTEVELKALASTVDEQDSLADIKKVFALANDWRDQLQNDMDDDTQGNLTETIKFMTGAQKMRQTDTGGSARLAALGIIRTPEEKLATLRRQLELATIAAAEKTKRIGFTEYVIDNLIATSDVATYDMLPLQIKEALSQKFLEALDKAELRAIENEELHRIYGDSLTATDIVMLRDIKKAAIPQIFIPSQPPAPPVVHDPNMPGPAAVRVRAGTRSREEIAAEKKHDDKTQEFIDNYQPA